MGERRDLVFDCPCSAQWVASGVSDTGTLKLQGGVQNVRATESGEVRFSFQWWTGRDGASVGRSGRSTDRLEGEWTLDLRRPEADETITLYLVEETAVNAEGSSSWHGHESISLWPTSTGDETTTINFVDLLTDTDEDCVGDVNERLAGTAWEDAESVPGESVVDLLLLYTAEFREEEDGYPYTRLLHLANVASATFEDNDTNVRLQLIGVSEVELGSDGWANSTDRNRAHEQPWRGYHSSVWTDWTV